MKRHMNEDAHEETHRDTTGHEGITKVQDRRSSPHYWGKPVGKKTVWENTVDFWHWNTGLYSPSLGLKPHVAGFQPPTSVGNMTRHNLCSASCVRPTKLPTTIRTSKHAWQANIYAQKKTANLVGIISTALCSEGSPNGLCRRNVANSNPHHKRLK